jgi:hypothetical protein
MPFSDSGEWDDGSYFDQPMDIEEFMQQFAAAPAPAPVTSYDFYNYDQAYDPTFFDQPVAAPAYAAPAPAVQYVAPTPAPAPYDFYNDQQPYEQPFDFMVAAPAPAPTFAPAPAPVAQQDPYAFYQDFSQPYEPTLDFIGAASPAPAPVAAPAPAPVAAPAPAPAEDGYWSTIGSGEDRQDVWVSNAPAPAPAEQYIGSNRSAAESPFDWSKYGFTGNAGVYRTTEGEEGKGAETYLAGSSKEFDDWLAKNGYQTTYRLSGNTGTQTRTDYLLDKNGNVIDTKQSQVDLGGDSWLWKALDTIQAVAPMLILNAALPGVGSAVGSTLGGAAGQAAISGGLGSLISSGGNVEAALKGAVLGGLGGAASGYINPAVADVVKASELTGTAADVLSGALKGGAGSAVGAALRGDSIADALLSGALGGGVSSGVSNVVGQTGLPTEIANIVSPAATAAILGKDPQAAAVNALIGQVLAGSKSGAGQPAETTTVAQAPEDTTAATGGGSAAGAVAAVNPAELPEGVADAITQFMQQGQTTAPAETATTTSSIENALYNAGIQPADTEQATVEDILQTISDTAPATTTAGTTTTTETTPAETTTTTDIAPAETTTATAPVDTTAATADTVGNVTDTDTVADILGGTEEGVADTQNVAASDLTDQEAEDRQGVADILESLGQTTGTAEAGVPDYTEDLPPEDKAIETKQLTDEDIANMDGYGNLEQDYAVTDTGKVLDTSTGQTGIFDENGDWSADYDIGSLAELTDPNPQRIEPEPKKAEEDYANALDQFYSTDPYAGSTLPRDTIAPLDLSGSLDEFSKEVDLGKVSDDQLQDLSEGLDDLLKTDTGTKTTGGGKTTTGGGGGTTTTQAKSNDDLLMMLLAMGLLDGEQQQAAPVQQLFSSNTDLKKIFGDYFA